MRAGLSTGWVLIGADTRLESMVVRSAPGGAVIRATCTGRGKNCPFSNTRSWTVPRDLAPVALRGLTAKRRLRAGARITVVVSATGFVTRTFRYTIARNSAPDVRDDVSRARRRLGASRADAPAARAARRRLPGRPRRAGDRERRSLLRRGHPDRLRARQRRPTSTRSPGSRRPPASASPASAARASDPVPAAATRSATPTRSTVPRPASPGSSCICRAATTSPSYRRRSPSP